MCLEKRYFWLGVTLLTIYTMASLSPNFIMNPLWCLVSIRFGTWLDKEDKNIIIL